MEGYCISFENENSTVAETKQNRLMLLRICAISGQKTLTFVKYNEDYDFGNT